TASVAEATRSRSPGVSSAAFCAQPPDLRFAPLMDMDFAVSCPLVRHWRLISGFCPSTRTFDPCFFQTPPRGGSPCIITRPSPPSGWPEDLHLQAAEHAQHTTNPRARCTLRVVVVQALCMTAAACHMSLLRDTIAVMRKADASPAKANS